MSPGRSGQSIVGALSIGGIMASSFACIIPDKDIEFRTASNRNPVRIVEYVNISVEADEACLEQENFSCPLVPQHLASHLFDPDRFCTCPDEQVDSEALSGPISFFAEDQDEEEGSFTDEIRGALLLDLVANSTVSMDQNLAYLSYLDPDIPARFPVIAYDSTSIEFGRVSPGLREFTFGPGGNIDLCNGSGRGPLSPGLHTFTLIVTDRPWFTAVFDDGDTVSTIQQRGVPDIASGATFSTATYVFNCKSIADDVACELQCEPLDE